MRPFTTPVLVSGCALFAVWLALPISELQAQSANSVAQTEIIRRQESLLRNSKALNVAAELMKIGKFDEARPILEKVITEVTPTGQGAVVKKNAELMLSQVELHDATEAYKAKEFLVSRDKARKALDNNPDNKAAQRLYAEVNKMVGGSPKNPSQLNPAIDQKFITNINRVQELIKLGQDQMGTGQFDKAESSFQQALAIDRGNRVAAGELKKLYAAQTKLAEVKSTTANKEKIVNVDNNWAETFKVDVLRNTAAPEDSVAIRKSNTFNINQKLKNIIIKNINFDQGTTIEDAASFLTLKSREEDPAKEGVSFLIRSDDTKAGARPFALSLKNIPLIDALRYITNLAGVKYKIEEYAVFVVPITSREETLIRREFRVPVDFFDSSTTGTPESSGSETRRTPITATATSSADSQASVARKALETRGVAFPEGAVAIYSPATSTLTVLNTQDQIDFIEELVSGEGQQETLMVKVETRVVEINQNDLNSLAFNYNLAGNFTGLPNGFSGSSLNSSGVSAQTQLSGPNGIPSNGIDEFLDIFNSSQSSVTTVGGGGGRVPSNDISVKGFLDGNGFSILMSALNQKKSFNTITAPSVVVLDKATGTINVSREFRFPTAYDPPESSPRTVTIGIVSRSLPPTIVPAFPSGFGESPGDEGFAEIGVTSTVTPQIQPNRKSVRLTINPQVLDFEGFINYGVPIFTTATNPIGLPSDDPILISNNVIKVPIFNRRTIDRSTVEIEDGYTLVMGGLIRENIDTLDEKVPFLGDLPVIGRVFRSKTERTVKKNLMIFVTVRIIRPNGEPLNVLSSEMARAR